MYLLGKKFLSRIAAWEKVQQHILALLGMKEQTQDDEYEIKEDVL